MALLPPSKQRNASVFGVALTELFMLLLFLVVFLWIATAPQKALPNDISYDVLQQRLAALEDKHKELMGKLAEVEGKLRQRDDQLKLLWEIYKKKPVTISPGSPEWEKWLEAWYQEVQKGLGGRGHANCLGKGALLRLTVLDEGIAVDRAWSEVHEPLVTGVAAVKQLVAEKRLPIARFEELGAQIIEWSEKQQPKCRFDVMFVDKATLKEPFAAAIRAIDRVFYKSETRG
jgi:hypothetical protein